MTLNAKVTLCAKVTPTDIQMLYLYRSFKIFIFLVSSFKLYFYHNLVESINKQDLQIKKICGASFLF